MSGCSRSCGAASSEGRQSHVDGRDAKQRARHPRGGECSSWGLHVVTRSVNGGALTRKL